MTERAVLSIVCVSQPGMLPAVARRLFELGCNLAHTTFAALAGTAEFTAVCELPPGLTREALVLDMQRLPEIAGGRVVVSAYEGPAEEKTARRITHRFEFSGRDRPGLILALTEAFGRCGAHVVRLNSQSSAEADQNSIRFAVAVADDAADRCRAEVTEAARELDLDCRIETA